MKLNPKVFRALTGEPVAVQEIDGTRVEFHYMDDTPYLSQYAARGRFAIWTSEGKDTYRVLIESTYYETMKPFYEQGVNKIWLGFLEKVGTMSRKTNLMFLIPTMVAYAIAVTLFSIFWPEQMMILLLIMLGGVIVTNMIQSRYINNKVKEENGATQFAIKAFIGEDEFNELVKKQEDFYAAYFKTEEPEAEVSTEGEEPEVIETTVEETTEEKKDDK